ncbi:HAMP domain-containing protein, partial [Piscinibacter sakaiensis]|uniref:HAMP domain-containing protein n=1 Tax=Piscinibacter sakaiensis TaxID=1547922 RepID=UPI0006B4A0B3
MKIRSKVLLAPGVAILMLLVTVAFAAAMTWQLKAGIATFHEVALARYESALTARGRLSEAHALAYRTLTWAANLEARELAAARKESGEVIGDAARRLGLDLQGVAPAGQEALHAELKKFAKTLDRAMELSAIEPTDGIAIMRGADTLALSLGQAADRRVAEADSAAKALAAQAEGVFHTVLWVLGGVLGVAVAVSVGAARWVANSLLGSITQAREAAARLASGDLGGELRARSRDELGELIEALGRAVASFRDALRGVRDAATSIHTASSEVSSGNHDLSARTEQQSSNLQQTAASMEELTGTVRSSADNAREAHGLATEASQVAARGGQVVGHVVENMQQIQASSQRIAEILGVIDGIA